MTSYSLQISRFWERFDHRHGQMKGDAGHRETTKYLGRTHRIWKRVHSVLIGYAEPAAVDTLIAQSILSVLEERVMP
jgi:hypothetical protein